MSKRNILKWIVLAISIATNLFIIINSFINGDASNAESSVITSSAANTINSISPGTLNNDNFESFVVFIRKVFGHFCLFGLSGVMTTWAFYLFATDTKYSYFCYFGFMSFLFGLLMAWLSEFVQIFIPGRSGSAADVLLDTLGYFVGVLAVIFVLFLAKKPIFQKKLANKK